MVRVPPARSHFLSTYPSHELMLWCKALESADTTECKPSLSVHKYLNLAFSCVQVASEWESTGCRSLFSLEDFEIRLKSSPAVCEVDYSIKIYICFSIQMLAVSETLTERLPTLSMACLGFV